MSTHLWDLEKIGKVRRKRLEQSYKIGLQRFLLPRRAKAFAMYAEERIGQGSIDWLYYQSFESAIADVLKRVKKITIDKYSQPMYLDAFDRLNRRDDDQI